MICFPYFVCVANLLAYIRRNAYASFIGRNVTRAIATMKDTNKLHILWNIFHITFYLYTSSNGTQSWSKLKFISERDVVITETMRSSWPHHCWLEKFPITRSISLHWEKMEHVCSSYSLIKNHNNFETLDEFEIFRTMFNYRVRLALTLHFRVFIRCDVAVKCICISKSIGSWSGFFCLDHDAKIETVAF